MEMIGGLARGLNRAAWFVTNQGLRLTLGSMEVFNPYWPKWILWLASEGLLKVSDVLNQRWLLDPLMSIGSSAAIKFVRPEHGDDVAEDTREFLNLGIDQYLVSRGTAKDDTDNCFFPESLAAGPILVPRGTAPMTVARNVEIAESCAVLSMLSYRHDDIIVDCMENAVPPMLPDTSLFSAHTREEADLAVFVANNEKWAVFCFRGTEPETLRDWLTSALLSKPIAFYSEGDPIRVRARYVHQMRTAAQEAELKYHTGNVSRDGADCAYDLALSLHKRGCKVYLTGHSLGGGLCTLLGADLSKSAGLAAAGIISFGSPAVGNQDFCDWFNAHFGSHETKKQSVPAVSWRFVNGDEFAPMAPPLPFTDTESAQQFHHVGGLIQVESALVEPEHDQRTRDEMVSSMKKLAREGNLSKIILDHNLATTLRTLRELHEELG